MKEGSKTKLIEKQIQLWLECSQNVYSVYIVRHWRKAALGTLGKRMSLKNEDVKSSTNIKMLKLLPREVKLHGYDHTVGYSRIGKKIFLDLD